MLRCWFYWKTGESRTKGPWELHAALRKVIENHRYKWCDICKRCSIWNDYGIVFQTLIIAASFQPIDPVEQYSDNVKGFCWVSVLRMHAFFERECAVAGFVIMNGRFLGHELSISAVNLITLKLFCILCYFLQQKVCSIVFSNYCRPNYWDFCAAYREVYLLLYHIQTKDA